MIKLTITCEINKSINNIICGFIIKNDKGLEILGENTNNAGNKRAINKVEKGETLLSTFVFTMPLLRAGNYSITASVAEGTQEKHIILHWKNDALLMESTCNSIGAGLAGLPMHSIMVEKL